MRLRNLFRQLFPRRQRSRQRVSLTCREAVESLEQRSLLTSMYVGTNLDGVVDWGATAFVDVFKEARNWQTRNQDGSGPWTTELGALIPTTDSGWPAEVPFDPGNGEPQQLVHTVIPVRGAGTYQMNVEGTGDVSFFAGDALLDPTTPFGRTVDFTFSGGIQSYDLEIHESEHGDGIGHLFMTINSSDPADPIRNMELIRPGHEATHESQPFMASYTDDLAPFTNLRFMDWGETNNNPLQTWADRTTPDSHSQTRDEGVSLEYMIQLSNQLQQDAWFTIPAAADDAYVRNMADMVRDNLNPDLKIFVEYSNETWNGIFQQSGYVQTQGTALNLDENPWLAGHKYVSLRSAEIWNIFEQQLGDQAPDRLVKVMATQGSFEFISETRMNALLDPAINPTGIMPDTLAIAPYFGGAVADQIVTDGLVDTITTDEILDRAEADLRGDVTTWVTSHKALADEFGIWLITYEGGQHLVATFENVSNQTLTDKLITANRDPRMYDLYTEYLDMLRDGGVSLHSNFSYVAEPSQWGSWGTQEDQDQPIGEAHKYRALTDWAAANPVTNLAPKVRVGDDVQLIDDGDGMETVQLDGSASRDLDGEVTAYEWRLNGEVIGTEATLSRDLSVGLHHVELMITDDFGDTATDIVNVSIAPRQASEVLVESNFAGTSPSQHLPWTGTQQLHSDLTFSGWTIGAGFSSGDHDDGLSFVGVFGADESTVEDAFTNDRYLSFTVDANEGHALNASGADFSFTINRIDWHAPRQYLVTSSIDGHAADQALFETGRFTDLGPSNFEFTLPFSGFETGEPIEFRIYGYGAQFGGHHASLAGFRLNGDIVAETPNSPPVAVADEFSTFEDVSITFNAGDLLGNDTDAEDDTLTIVEASQPANGTLVDNGDGTYSYTPNAGFTGTDTFTYTITDGPDTPSGPTPVNSVRQFTFNHSLWDDAGGVNAVTGYWIGEFANAAGTDYAWNGQFGQLDYHQIGDGVDPDTGPFPQLGSTNSDDVFPNEETHFRDINIDNVLIMPPNFVQVGSQTAQPELITHAQRVIDYVVDEGPFGGQHSEAPVYIYEHWQEATSYPLTGQDWIDYHDVTTGDYHQWFIDYQDQLIASRPNIDFRMIPVGPIIAEILQNPSLQASSLTFDDMYRDEAPHGHPNAYFLAGLVTYQAMYAQQADDSYRPPITTAPGTFSDGGISPEIANDLAALNNFVWERLNHYNENGVRVWPEFSGSGDSSTSTATVTITVHPDVDLRTTSFDALSDHLVPESASTDVTFTVVNDGSSDAGAFETVVVWSEDAVLDETDLVLTNTTTTFAGLGAGESQSRTITVEVPKQPLLSHARRHTPMSNPLSRLSTEASHLFLVVDRGNDVPETNEENNAAQGHRTDSDDITYFPWDSDRNGRVTPREALRSIFAIGTSAPRHDYDGNGRVTPLEALATLQRLGFERNAAVFERNAAVFEPASFTPQSDPIVASSGFLLEDDTTPSLFAADDAETAVAQPVREDSGLLVNIDNSFSDNTSWLDVL